MEIKKIVSSLLDSNVFVLSENNHCLIIDSGASSFITQKEVDGKKVDAILLTHGHYDHSYYCNEQAKMFDCKIYASNNIKDTLTDSKTNCGENDFTITDFSNFVFLAGDGEMTIENWKIKFFALPGHSKCSMGYLINGNFFVGDVLFEKSFGRVDLKGGSKTEMLGTLKKIENIAFNKVYSGHGNDSDKNFQLKNIQLYKRFLTR